jgi:glycosyltransferase involved in cell wall biosynthesis
MGPTVPSAPPPWLSVVIPVFNPGSHLAATLDSLAAGSPNGVEVLVQNGGPREPVEEMARASRLEDIFVSTEPDTGVYDAMNRAIARSRGAHILVLGAGDRVAAGALAEIRPILVATDPPALYGDVWMEDLGKRYRGKFRKEDFFHHNICQQGLFYARRVFQEFGPFPAEYPILADYAFNIRLFARHWEKIHYWPGVVSHYLGGGMSALRWKEDPFVPLRKDTVAADFGIPRPKSKSKGK